MIGGRVRPLQPVNANKARCTCPIRRVMPDPFCPRHHPVPYANAAAKHKGDR